MKPGLVVLPVKVVVVVVVPVEAEGMGPAELVRPLLVVEDVR